jgi:hypothetical protein
MFKTMMAGVAALSLGLTPAPAVALTDDEVAQILLGLLAAGVVSRIIEEREARSLRERQELPRITVDPPRTVRAGSLLPRQCLEDVETQRGPQRIFGGRCLNRHYAATVDLPQDCAVRVRGYDGPRHGFDARCLREHGYRATRH